MIEAVCACGNTIQAPEDQANIIIICPSCERLLTPVSAEQLGDGTATLDFDTRLVVEHGPQREGEQFLLGGTDDITIGKLPACHIRLIGERVSRDHCRLKRLDFGPSRWKVIDNGSTNGVKVNGERLPERELVDGDELKIGEYRLRYQAGPPAAAAGPLEAAALVAAEGEPLEAEPLEAAPLEAEALEVLEEAPQEQVLDAAELEVLPEEEPPRAPVARPAAKGAASAGAPPPPLATIAAAAPPMARVVGQRTCPACGNAIAPAAIICPHCRAPLLAGAPAARTAPVYQEDSSLTGGEWALAIICSTIGCIMGIVWMCQGKPKGIKMLGISIAADILKSLLYMGMQAAAGA